MGDRARFEMFAYWRTSATYRARVALALKGLQAEERLVNLETGEQRGEAFLRINPLGAIPALIDREAPAGTPPITQSLAILEYLEEVHPDPAILPGDAAGRARVRSLAGMLASDTHPLIPARVTAYLTGTAGLDAAAVQAWRVHWLMTGLQAFERRLAVEAGTGTFCHGEHITIADICLASIRVILPLFKIEVAGTPIIDRIFATCEKYEAFIQADPARQAGAPGRSNA
jgi:maleylacetoacetate isomerase/maleylpyruvate isomerase